MGALGSDGHGQDGSGLAPLYGIPADAAYTCAVAVQWYCVPDVPVTLYAARYDAWDGSNRPLHRALCWARALLCAGAPVQWVAACPPALRGDVLAW